MGIERIFLGWDRPGLLLAVDYLCERFADGDLFDLGETIVAVPGSRAGRRLLERLVERSEATGRPLCPPQIITAGRLPELLYTPKRPFACTLAQQLAWVEALRAAPADRLANLVPQPPEATDLPAWLSMAEMVGRLHRELAAEAMDFRAVADCGARLDGFGEHERWATLAEVQDKYLATLDGLGLWDLQTARLFAVRHGECRIDRPIILVGTVDLNRLQRMMLEAVADRVTALVFAPPSMADRFDELGCLRAEAWQELPVAVRDEQIEVAGSPSDQAAAAVRAIAALDGRYAADEITVGVPDERVVPYVMQQFHQCGLHARHGVGEPLAQTGPYRLLAAVADYLAQSSFASLAALVRHPDLARWIEQQGVRGDWLSQLDRYHVEHLPRRIDGYWLGRADEYPLLRAAYEAVEQLLRPLAERPREIGVWGAEVAGLLVAVYGTRPLSTDDPADRTILAACEKIHAALVTHADIHPHLMPRVAAAEAIRMALRAVAAETVPAAADTAAIELLGWLELPLDDAPVLVATGMNEGIVPTSLGADLFLPNQMRRALGIEDNQRRLARDCYALSVLVASRRELKLIAGRRSPDGDPMLPSRLLLAADAETTARRVRRLFRGDEESAAPLPGAMGGSSALGGKHKGGRAAHGTPLVAGRAESAFAVPRPAESPAQVESMRVTEFRDYLACPYRYYLRHRLRLEGLADHVQELDGAAFGSLAHEVLGAFGRSDAAGSTDAEEIAALLEAELAAAVKRIYGSRPLSSIRVQAEQLAARLRAFARWQAGHAAEGWRIDRVEEGPSADKALLDVDDRPIGLRGRIDRIDVHDATGRRIVLDYKTSDRVEPPERSHRKAGAGWVDLQLPLYRRLARGLGIEGPVGLGYIALPKDVACVGLLEAQWNDADLAEADETARRVVRAIRAGKFWPPADPPPAFSEEFAAICQDGQFAAALADEEAGDEEETP